MLPLSNVSRILYTQINSSLPFHRRVLALIYILSSLCSLFRLCCSRYCFWDLWISILFSDLDAVRISILLYRLLVWLGLLYTSTFLLLLSIVRIGFLLQLQVVRQIHHVQAVRLGVDIFLFNFLYIRHSLNLCPSLYPIKMLQVEGFKSPMPVVGRSSINCSFGSLNVKEIFVSLVC